MLDRAKQRLESTLQDKGEATLSVILIVIGLVVIGVGLLPNHRLLKIVVILYTLLP